jgi:hypothetical protein
MILNLTEKNLFWAELKLVYRGLVSKIIGWFANLSDCGAYTIQTAVILAQKQKKNFFYKTAFLEKF